MIMYVLQVMLFQAIFIVVYELLLKKETFFNYNRVYLLGTSVLALIIPFLRFEVFKNITPERLVLRLPEIHLYSAETVSGNHITETEITQGIVNNVSNFNWNYLVFSGIAIAFIVFLVRLFKLFQIIKLSEIQKAENFVLIQLKSSKAAYSFFNLIFLGEHISEEEKHSIIHHEKVHAKEKHTADLLWFECLKIVFWFNPLNYIYQNKIKEVHEFIADAKASKLNKSGYKNVLLNQLFQSQNLSFVNPFYKKSLIKTRLIMLSQKKSNQKNLIKYLAVLPIVGVMLIYSSCVGEQEIENDEIIEVVETEFENNPANNVTFNINEVDRIALFPDCENLNNEDAKKCFATEITKIVSENFNPKLSQELNLKGTVRIITKFVVNEEGEITEIKARAPHERLVAETERVLNLVPKLKPALKDNKPVRVNYALPIKFEIK